MMLLILLVSLSLGRLSFFRCLSFCSNKIWWLIQQRNFQVDPKLFCSNWKARNLMHLKFQQEIQVLPCICHCPWNDSNKPSQRPPIWPYNQERQKEADYVHYILWVNTISTCNVNGAERAKIFFFFRDSKTKWHSPKTGCVMGEGSKCWQYISRKGKAPSCSPFFLKQNSLSYNSGKKNRPYTTNTFCVIT